MNFKRLPLLFFVAAVSCTTSGAEIAQEDKEKEEMSELERFENLVLKSDMEKLQEGTYLISAEKGDFDYELRFSDGTAFILGRRYSAFVSSDEDRNITINGKSSGHKVVDCPWYTIDRDGMWLNQGSATGKSAIPDPKPGYSGPAVLRYALQNSVGMTAFFSDGTSLEFRNPEVKNEMFVSKTASKLFIYIGKENGTEFVCYPIGKRYKAYQEGQYPSFLDNWGLAAIRLCSLSSGKFDDGVAMFLPGESELAMRVTDGNDPTKETSVGGSLHGFENIVEEAGQRQFFITVDGKDISETGTLELTRAEKIVLRQKSLFYQAYTKENPFGEVSKTWTFENGRMTIRNEMKLLRDIHYYQASFGMMCVLRRWNENTSNPYLTRYAVKDNKPLCTIDISDGFTSIGKDRETRSITEYGELGWKFTLSVEDCSSSEKTSMFIATNGNGYNKIYFDLTGTCDRKAGETLWSLVRWDIEKE